MSPRNAVEMGSQSPTTTEHLMSYAASHPILDRIPARGILKEEHDAWVSQSGRAYTDRFVSAHLGEFDTSGVKKKASSGLKP